MVKFSLTAVLLGGFVFSMGLEASAGQSMDELNERLSSLEAGQRTLRENLEKARHKFGIDIYNATQFCQDLKVQVEQQSQILQEIREAMEGGGPSNPSTPEPDRSGPCADGEYEVIDDTRRSSDEKYLGYDEICDRSLSHKWYRFKLDGKNAVMPTACVPENYCYTDAPLWLNLNGKSLPAVGQQLDADACANWVSDCCNWKFPITVRNCGDFFVYRITPPDVCDLAFCAQPHDDNFHFGTPRPQTTTESSTSHW